MPSTLHEGLICLFRADPQLVVDLVAHGYGLRLTPRPGMLVDRNGDLAVDADQHLRVNARCVDLVLVCEDPTHPEGGAVIALEVQLDVDRDKRQRITTYLALLADRHKLPVHLVVVALRDRVARNLATWRLGTALEVHPFILDRHLVPAGVDLKTGHGRPSLAIYAGAIGFELAAHFAGRGARVVMACRNLDKGAEAERRLLARAAKAQTRLATNDLGPFANTNMGENNPTLRERGPAAPSKSMARRGARADPALSSAQAQRGRRRGRGRGARRRARARATAARGVSPKAREPRASRSAEGGAARSLESGARARAGVALRVRGPRLRARAGVALRVRGPGLRASALAGRRERGRALESVAAPDRDR